MARAARLSGAEPDDEDYEEFEEMLEQAESAQVRNVFSMTHMHCTGTNALHVLCHNIVGNDIFLNFLKQL